MGRSTLRRHDKQLRSFRRGKFLETTAKSIFGLVDGYNLLPQGMIDVRDVHGFQRKLQGILKHQAMSNATGWETLYSPRHVLHNHPLANLLNKVVSTNASIGDMESEPDPGLDFDLGEETPGQPIGDKPPSWW